MFCIYDIRLTNWRIPVLNLKQMEYYCHCQRGEHIGGSQGACRTVSHKKDKNSLPLIQRAGMVQSFRSFPGKQFLPEIIDFRPEEQDAHAEIEPQKQQHNSCKASVHIGVILPPYMAEIQGKGKGEGHPPNGGEHGSRKLVPELQPLIRHKGIDSQEKYNQYHQRPQGPEINDVGGHVRYDGKTAHHERLNHVAEHQQAQGQDTHQDEHNGVS